MGKNFILAVQVCVMYFRAFIISFCVLASLAMLGGAVLTGTAHAEPEKKTVLKKFKPASKKATAKTSKKKAIKKSTSKKQNSKKAKKKAPTKYVKMPAGNHYKKQPGIPTGAISRTRATNGSFEGKYRKIRDLIKTDAKLNAAIKSSAKKFGIEPVHIVGALVGEHTYNVDALDHIQTYFVKAASCFESAISFEYDGEHVTKFIKRPQFEKCDALKSSYHQWDCREDVWRAKFYGKKLDGKKWPKNRFGAVFFQPLYAGQTFGLGQLNPLTALRVDDLVRRTKGTRALNAKDAPQVYKTIMDPKSALDYMAAVIKTSITAYREVAGVDISKNPGITATLYNLGDVYDRAYALKKKRKRSKNIFPRENYYGWLVNKKLKELYTLVK